MFSWTKADGAYLNEFERIESRFNCSRKWVVSRTLCHEGLDTGVVIFHDSQDSSHLFVTSHAGDYEERDDEYDTCSNDEGEYDISEDFPVGVDAKLDETVLPLAGEVKGVLKQVVKFINEICKQHHAITVHISLFKITGLQDMIKKKFLYIEIEKGEEIAITRFPRKPDSRTWDLLASDCMVTVGVDNNTVALPRDRVQAGSLTFKNDHGRWSTDRAVVCRRKIYMHKDESKFLMALHPPLMFTDLPDDDKPFKIRTKNSASTPTNRFNKLRGVKAYYAHSVTRESGFSLYVIRKLFFDLVEDVHRAAQWAANTGRSIEEFTDVYDFVPFFKSLRNIPDDERRESAAIIQRLWRRVSSDPYHPIGQRVLRARFAHFV